MARRRSRATVASSTPKVRYKKLSAIRVPRRVTFGDPRRVVSPNLRLYEDRRHFHPEKVFRPARAFRVAARRIVPGKPVKSQPHIVPATVAFANPKKVIICVRRKVRKRVLMAKGVGGSRVRKPRYSYHSEVAC